MANKGNASIAIDRQSVADYVGIVATYAGSIEDRTNALKSTFDFLTNDAEISGDDTQNIKENVETVKQLLNEVNSKFGILAKATSKLSNDMGIVASAKKAKLSDAQAEMDNIKKRLTETGK